MEALHLTIDGRRQTVAPGTTVLEAIRQAGIYVPTLCDDPDLKPFGACRLCLVEIEGMRGLPTSCTTPAQDGMVVWTENEEILRMRRIIIELVLANHPQDCLVCPKAEECELLKVANYLGADKARVARLRRGRLDRPVDDSTPGFVYDPNKCILCGKCVRACQEVAFVGAIDFAYRGQKTIITPFWNQSLLESVCQSCGECVARCPTGALSIRESLPATRQVETICPYCGVGCGVRLGVRQERIVRVEGVRENPVSRGELCVKGRFGLDFVHSPERLATPLVRKENIRRLAKPPDPRQAFREAGWEEALELTANALQGLIHEYGSDCLGVLSSAKCTNEDNYVTQKFARAVLKTNNVDHCARLCHASTVTAALAAFGDGAMSNSISDFEKTDVILVIGSNTTECHPVIGRRIKRAVQEKEAKLLVADPRAVELSDQAELFLNHLPGTDVALLNGLMNRIVELKLHNRRFIARRCENYKAFAESLADYTPEVTEATTGVPAEKIQRAARILGKAKRLVVAYGMGITQHVTGTDNVKAVANLLMLTGNMGRPGCGFAPLRGQNNVQGACDMGALPNVYPGYQRVDNPEVKAKFELAWGAILSDRPGLTLTEMIKAAHTGSLKGLYIVGENPMLSEADLNHAKEAMARLGFIAVQDIFLTETAALADVVFPSACFAEKEGSFTNTERRIQKVNRALNPPGQAREDWRILSDLAALLGRPFAFANSAEIMNEIASLTPIYGGISHDRLGPRGLQWPCWNRRHKGSAMLHKGRFTRGRGRFHVVHDRPPAELPSAEYPLLLTTGRILEHWHTGSMTHRSRVLETLAPESRIEINPQDAAELGVTEGDTLSIKSRRGQVRSKARTSRRVSPGQTFMAFHWQDAPANSLTNPSVDPVANIPEYKVASVKAVLEVLDLAAEDNAFLTALSENPAGILKDYDLSPEHRLALLNLDFDKLQEWVGPLNERLRLWLHDRLAKEKWVETE